MLHVIFNPVAGRGRASAALDDLMRHLESLNAGHVLHVTTEPGHATELAAATPEDATVIAVGGDGTVHEVVAGLLQAEGTAPVRSRTLAVVPVGSGDDFAFALGLKRGDVAAAIDNLATGSRRHVDVGSVNGVPFVNAFSTGFDARVAHRLDAAPGFLKGLAAYLYATAISLGDVRPVGVRVELDGELFYEGRSLLVAVQNGPRTGGSFLYAPAAQPDDGLLEVVIAGDLSLLGTLSVLPRVMRGRHVGHPKILMGQARSLSVRWEAPRYGHADGESIPVSDRFEVELTPGGLALIR